MSQFWNAHWAEDSFKPVRLGNWQVPNWHPKWPCSRHCATTTFLADNSGRLLPGLPRSKRSPWGDFKGTWELPLKIDRKLARKLSAPPRYKLAAWEAHKSHHEVSCGTIAVNTKKINKKNPVKQEEIKNDVEKNMERKEKMVAKTKKADRTAEGNELNGRWEWAEVTNEKTKEPEEEEEEEEEEKERVVDKQSAEQGDREHYKESEKPKCPCEHKSDSHPVIGIEKIPKSMCNKICAIHQRLRV